MGERVALVWYEGNEIIARDYDHWGDGEVIPRLKAVLEIWDTAATKNTDTLRLLYYIFVGIDWHNYGLSPEMNKHTIYFNDFTDDPKKQQGDLQRIYHIRVENGNIYVKIEEVTDWSTYEWVSSKWHELHYWLKNKDVVWYDWKDYVKWFEAAKGLIKHPERTCALVQALIKE